MATYDYRSEDGDLLHQTVRYQPKGFAQRQPDGNGGWRHNLKGVSPVLYRLPGLLESPDGVVFVTEGEKDADRLAGLGFTATTNPMGAGKWRDEYSRFLAGRRIVILPDNDDPGHRHAESVAKSVATDAESVQVLDLPGLGPGEDVGDWLDAGDTVDELLQLAEAAPTYRPQPGGAGDALPQLVITPLNGVSPQRVEWLWPQRIPVGKLTLLGGDPGLGKSYLTLDLASRISLGGPWPDGGDAPENNVLIVTAEDGLSDTVRPRLDLLDADVSRIYSIDITVKKGQQDEALSLDEHLGQIEETIASRHAGLLIIDPILAIMGRRTDTFKTSEVRPVLARLAGMAERTRCAVLAVMHLNKKSSEGNAIYRLTASLDFGAAARSVLIVGNNPDDPKRRVLVSAKSNLSAPPAALGFHFSERGDFVWEQETLDIDAQSLLSVPQNSEKKGAMAEAESFLREVLGDGAQNAAQVYREAKEADISAITLRRARGRLGVLAVRTSKGNEGNGYWVWQLPENPEDDSQAPSGSGDDHLVNELPFQTEIQAFPQDGHGEHLAAQDSHAGPGDDCLVGAPVRRDGESSNDPNSRKMINPETPPEREGGGGATTTDAQDDDALRLRR